MEIKDLEDLYLGDDLEILKFYVTNHLSNNELIKDLLFVKIGNLNMKKYTLYMKVGDIKYEIISSEDILYHDEVVKLRRNGILPELTWTKRRGGPTNSLETIVKLISDKISKILYKIQDFSAIIEFIVEESPRTKKVDLLYFKEIGTTYHKQHRTDFAYVAKNRLNILINNRWPGSNIITTDFDLGELSERTKELIFSEFKLIEKKKKNLIFSSPYVTDTTFKIPRFKVEAFDHKAVILKLDESDPFVKSKSDNGQCVRIERNNSYSGLDDLKLYMLPVPLLGSASAIHPLKYTDGPAITVQKLSFMLVDVLFIDLFGKFLYCVSGGIEEWQER